MSKLTRRMPLGQDNSFHISQIKTSVDALIATAIAALDLDDQTIHPSQMMGTNGFVEGNYYGPALLVAFSDANAIAWASFYVRDGGDFKLSIVHSGNGANNGKTAGGVLYVSYDVADGAGAWDVGPQDWNIAIDNATILKINEYSTAITVSDDSHVGMRWGKDDNAGGAAGNMYIYSIILKRQ